MSEVDEEEFHFEVMKKPLIGAGGDEGQMKDKIKGNYSSHANLTSRIGLLALM